MERVFYNAMKLSEYRPLFHDRKVLIIGTGAVGTYLMEYLAKMALSPDAADFDRFTLENAAKHSCLIRTPEDADRNKAVCASERVQPLLDEGCSSNGIECDLCKLGPEAFSDYEYVIVAVDNFDAKVLLNELIRQLPEGRRPVIIMDGTYDEMAQSVILDNTEFCIRCLIDEKWMKDSSIRTSCTGPQIRHIDGVPEIVRTSNLASSMAAHLSAEQLRGHVVGVQDLMNRRLTYTSFPNLELSSAHPMRKKDCIGCRVMPPEHIEWLEGNILETSLRDAMLRISEKLGTQDYEISVHRLDYRKVIHAGFVTYAACKSCGKPIKIMQHEGRLFYRDLICAECSSGSSHEPENDLDPHCKIIYAFTKDCAEEIQDMTMYDLGFPLGAHIEVIQRNGALDFLEENKVVKTIFAFKNDHAQMHVISKL